MKKEHHYEESALASVFLDVDEVLEELRLYWTENDSFQFNPSAFTNYKESGGNIMCCCPHHEELNPSFGILRDYPYTWQCFGCGMSGNLPQLVAHAVGLQNEILGEQFLLKNFVTMDATERPKIDLEAILDKNYLDKKSDKLDDELSQYLDKRHPYFYQRGFMEYTLKRYEIGFDEESGSMVIPVRTGDGGLRFIKRRYVFRKGFLNEKDVYKKDIVYGLYYIKQSPRRITELYLTESETDTMSCYQGGLCAGAVLGRILFKEQVHELNMAGIKVVNLFFDNDLWGVKSFIQAYDMLARESAIRVNIVLYPGNKYGIDTLDEEEIQYKDANDLLKAGKLNEITKVSYEEYLTMIKNKIN